MGTPLFDTDKCDIASIPSLEFDFLSDCSIQPAPPTIHDCPLPPIPRTPPPSCPEFDVAASASVGFDTGCKTTPPFQAALIITKTDNDPCRFFIDLDLNLRTPIPPCPDIVISHESIIVDYPEYLTTEEGRPSFDVVVTRTFVPPDCVEDSLTPGSCKFVMDFELNIPIPRVPCPAISIGEVSINADWQPDTPQPSTVVITRTKPVPYSLNDPEAVPDSCRFVMDFDLNIPLPIPVCPEITATLSVTAITITAPPTGTFTVTPTVSPMSGPDAPCQYDLQLYLQLPKPCVPQFWCSAMYPPDNCSAIEYLPEGSEPYIILTFEKNPAPENPGECDYEIGLQIGLVATEVEYVADISCVDGELYVTKDTKIVLIAPTAPTPP